MQMHNLSEDDINNVNNNGILVCNAHNGRKYNYAILDR